MSPQNPPKESIPFAVLSGQLLLRPAMSNHFELLADHWNLDTESDNFLEEFQARWARSCPRIGRAWREGGEVRFYVSRSLKSPEMSEFAEQDESGALKARLLDELALLI